MHKIIFKFKIIELNVQSKTNLYFARQHPRSRLHCFGFSIYSAIYQMAVISNANYDETKSNRNPGDSERERE